MVSASKLMQIEARFMSSLLTPASETEFCEVSLSAKVAPEVSLSTKVAPDCDKSDHKDYYACESEDEGEDSGEEEDGYAAFLKEMAGSYQASEVSESEDEESEAEAEPLPDAARSESLELSDSTFSSSRPQPSGCSRPQPLDLLLEGTRSPEKSEHQSPISDHCPLMVAPTSPRCAGSIFPQSRRDVPQGPSKGLSLALLACSLAWTTSGSGLTEDQLKLHCATFAQHAGAYGGGSRATILPSAAQKHTSCVV